MGQEKHQSELNQAEARFSYDYLVLISFLVCFCYFLIHILFDNLHYELNDDTAMNLLVAGAYGAESGHFLIFSNVLYGFALKVIYGLLPNINVYLLVMLCCNMFAVFFISAGIIRNTVQLFCSNVSEASFRIQALFSILITLTVNVILSPEFYASLQWTKNAGLYTAVGCMLAIVWFRSGFRFRDLLWIPSVFFFSLGYCVRKDSFLAVCAVSLLGVGTWCLIMGITWLKKNRCNSIRIKTVIEKNRNVVFFSCILMFSILVPAIANRIAYSSEEWQNYLKYNEYRSELLDYGMPDYKKHQKEYEALGFDEQDKGLLQNWIYSDPEKFSLETLEKIVEMKQSDKKTSEDIWQTAFHSISHMKGTLTSRAVAVSWLLLFVIIICVRRWDTLLIYIAITLGIYAETSYLYYVDRIPWRTEILPYLAAVTTLPSLAFPLGWKKKVAKQTVCVLIASICFIACMDLGGSIYSFAYEKKGKVFTTSDARVNDMLVTLNSRSDKFYLFTTKTRIDINRIDNITRAYQNMYANIMFTGGWTINSPIWQPILDAHDIQNPLLDLVNMNDKCFLVDNSGKEKEIARYLTKRTGKNIVVELVEELDGFKIWQYSSGE